MALYHLIFSSIRLYIPLFCILCFPLVPLVGNGGVTPGVEQLFTPKYEELVKGKRVGLITNQTGVTRSMQSSISLFKEKSKTVGFTLAALFSPEHGLYGAGYAERILEDEKDPDGIAVFSLYGKTRRPTKEMLSKIDVLVYDIQDIGNRSYTFVTTLFYAMEEAKKFSIPVVVLDRPNPINGVTIDGPMLNEKKRSMVGYINVPYCHGMTVGELATFFNKEYNIDCNLTVVPMEGWKRKMSFKETGLPWIPTSPQIPFYTTVFYTPITGILGEIRFINTGVGYTLPFEMIGAPWIDAFAFTQALNAQKIPGVAFTPVFYRPFFGRFADEFCQGALIHVTDHLSFKPVTTGFVIMGILKNLYPEKFQEALANSQDKKEMFGKVNGTDEVFRILNEEKYVIWKLRDLDREERENFSTKRVPYLNPAYD